MAIEQKITEVLERLRDDIANDLDQKGITASGRTRDGLKVIRYSGGIKLVSTSGNPLSTTEIGRPSGKVPFGFKELLFQWSKDKGIPFESDKERKSFAYLLARRIAKEGFGRPSKAGNSFGSKDPTIYSDKIPNTVTEIKEALKLEIKQIIKLNG
jgi:hypothetical protein